MRKGENFHISSTIATRANNPKMQFVLDPLGLHLIQF